MGLTDIGSTVGIVATVLIPNTGRGSEGIMNNLVEAIRVDLIYVWTLTKPVFVLFLAGYLIIVGAGILANYWIGRNNE